eukprot:5434224-Prymnesium_polylepis.3
MHCARDVPSRSSLCGHTLLLIVKLRGVLRTRAARPRVGVARAGVVRLQQIGHHVHRDGRRALQHAQVLHHLRADDAGTSVRRVARGCARSGRSARASNVAARRARGACCSPSERARERAWHGVFVCVVWGGRVAVRGGGEARACCLIVSRYCRVLRFSMLGLVA